VKLHPGDAVRLTVWRQPDLTGEFLVLPDGRLAHPLLQAVHVTDVRFLDAKERMRTVLRRYDAEPQFVMEPLLRVIVGGEVQRPDRYLLAPETDISQAVAVAGGLSQLGRRERVRLFRGGEEFMFDLGAIESGAQDVLVQSGDQIMVDRRSTVFRDYIAPIGGLLGGIASVISVIIISGK
jgi:polysaccharide export outer membrane protein